VPFVFSLRVLCVVFLNTEDTECFHKGHKKKYARDPTLVIESPRYKGVRIPTPVYVCEFAGREVLQASRFLQKSLRVF